jgi:TfoX/Sxy family transcriptional regulator of competence genes
MPMSIPKASPAVVQRFEELVPQGPGVTTQKMFGQPAAFVNGNLFFGVFGEKIFVRLSESEVAAARKLPGYAAFEPMPGRAMREYLVLPGSLLADRARARGWVGRSLRFASGLPAKKAKR